MTKRGIKRVFIWLGALIALVLVFWGMVKLSGNTPISSGSGDLPTPVTSEDHILGPSDAPITLVEYSDFQCPACAAFGPILDRLLDDPDLAGTLRIVYRNFPLASIHVHAYLAAQTAEAAALQGKFWEMHDILFENQTTWAGKSAIDARNIFLSYAQQLGLDIKQYTADLDSASVKEKVQSAYTEAMRAGLNSTPTFFVNGSRIPHPSSYDELKQYLLDANQ